MIDVSWQLLRRIRQSLLLALSFSPAEGVVGVIDHNGIFGQFYSAANVMLYFDEKAEDLMVTVKFFAGAREAAGTSSMEVEADSVQAALDAAVAASGDALARMISISKIWLNGEPAEPEAAVSSSDELAVLPPVSGGI